MNEEVTTSDVAAMLACTRTAAYHWLRKHHLARVAPGKWSRAEVLRVKAGGAVPQRQPEDVCTIVPSHLAGLMTVGTFKRMLGVSYESAHKILDNAAIPILRVSPGVRLVSRAAVEAFLSTCVEPVGKVALDQHQRARQQVARARARAKR